MAVNIRPIFIRAPRITGTKLSTAATDVDGSGSTLLYTADATYGSRVHALSINPTDDLSANVVFRLFIRKSSTYYILVEKVIPSYTETATVAAPMTSVLEYGDIPFLDPAEKYLVLGPGEDLYGAVLTTPTNPVHILVHGGDY